ncbi:UDP-N-acetylglucosamine--N-acetylmuramyl-(pentapeptide) pyrophosphoryl-undecaprenol N-acetylglucosamine transferase [Actinorhabdospora filicis]|uniref:UDP-N-acetylglucosamine--N-acetylmuramyl-(pentapeptide) pyrophosphoryl-undecaprenol N-acetylglucosamine transferase n=1 Tax=Actinorhabdospora filicis TaxID=1785913 RepID=A0A9W6SIN9_9ACTN|nr:UDP-N-acetylglucosamine--N-acetylmuramyl-(pentapeptide) pyrophosphoryl-undecaprenol N-acetylglucosamine transferase [Actinorhabdospora filicis]GLZ75371.1 UDP-N-acetylglucosamine--N-acetylmuramyl-(pentapeptide) pyrophosphoryl-undecaprenol N-acetylglucosamine transferase [Actinorhabdospora filicis]
MTPIRSVVLAGGGTGGHIYPLLAFADCLRRHDPSIRITCVGTPKGLEADIIPKHGYDLRMVPAHQLSRKINKDLLLTLPRMAKAKKVTRELLDEVAADVVVGFGGYVSVPAYQAAHARKTPMVIFEFNDPIGYANKLAMRYSSNVAVGFAHLVKTVPGLAEGTVTGVPLRREISTLDRAAQREAARAHFGLDPYRPTLFVFGASQGARSINNAVLGAARGLTDAGIQVLHVIGARRDDPVEVPAGLNAPYVTLPFLSEMHLGYAAADLVLCRGGAMTVAEVSAVGLPAAYVPLPWGNKEQYRNVRPVTDIGGGLVVDDENLSPDFVMRELAPLLLDGDRLARMGAVARSVGRTDGDEALRAFTYAAVSGR